jgi:hypothetical protein
VLEPGIRYGATSAGYTFLYIPVPGEVNNGNRIIFPTSLFVPVLAWVAGQ